MNILGIGQTNLDLIYQIPELPKEGTKIQSGTTIQSVGGPVPIALMLLARLGHTCQLITKLGLDMAGVTISQLISAEGVEVISHPASRTVTNSVLTSLITGSRTIIRAASDSRPITHIDTKLIQSADAILLDRHEPLAAEIVLSHIRPETLLITDTSNELSPRTFKLLQHSTVPVIPDDCLKHISLKKLRQLTPKPYIITAGAKGSYIYNGNLKLIPAHIVNTIDTLGAGDVFRGALTHSLLQQHSLEQATLYANHVAALQCTRLGNSTALPTVAELQAL